ncbi:hypothetical protein NX786_19405 [Telluria mixta]|uniref:Lipoprotein n=1 Tax=Telluria mixta TaxID=34071 RepID=A0ABT2C285_9BURK|nr:hypothetical protein [Telluria mixta]MCS0631500.1 hypothetical protein [Telluria mixta]WEM98258.1 hypothetical protein P0M04_11275 [Telluria mixta]
MKFSLARPALALAVLATLAACGGGGKATFPINVTVSNLQYSGLVLSTNGQDLTVNPPATAGQDVVLTFPNQLEYGQEYEVIPKGATVVNHTASGGAQPKHQTCSQSLFPAYGTAGQLAKIDIRFVCSINTYELSGTVKGLTGTGLVLANGSTTGTIAVSPVLDANQKPTGADIQLFMNPVPYNTTYGVTVLTQPTNPAQTCKVTGGANGSGGGTMDDAAEAAGGVKNLVVTCVNN